MQTSVLTVVPWGSLFDQWSKGQFLFLVLIKVKRKKEAGAKYQNHEYMGFIIIIEKAGVKAINAHKG